MRNFEMHQSVLDTDSTAISLLSQHCTDVSNKELKLALQRGAVWLTHGKSTNRIRRAKKRLVPGDELHLYFDEAILFSEINPAALVADQIDYSLWNKPCGMYSQGTKWGDHSAICRWIELQGFKENLLPERPAFLVHRLDRATQGLIIVAHSKQATIKLTGLFANRNVRKHYLARVFGHFPEASLNETICEPIEGKQATTRILEISYDAALDQSMLKIQLETGRKHQIRRHLAGLGFPIIGDRLYGDRIACNSASLNSKIEMPDLQLQSCFLEFTCPFSHELKSFELPAV